MNLSDNLAVMQIKSNQYKNGSESFVFVISACSMIGQL